VPRKERRRIELDEEVPERLNIRGGGVEGRKAVRVE